jgi:hypothetical protein
LFDVAGRESEINLQESRAFDGWGVFHSFILSSVDILEIFFSHYHGTALNLFSFCFFTLRNYLFVIIVGAYYNVNVPLLQSRCLFFL